MLFTTSHPTFCISEFQYLGGKIKHEYLRSRAYIRLSLSSPFSPDRYSKLTTIEILALLSWISASKEFFQRHVRTVHEKSVHENQKDFKCNSCDKKFSIKGNLKRHIEIVHENVKSFKCDSFEKSFGQKADLDTHAKTVHEKVKAFKCNSCDKSF